MAYNNLTLGEKLSTKAVQIGECLVWQGQTDARGYGFLRLGGRKQRAHRLAYELHVSPIPDGAVLRHTCDNTSCINPAHLEPGTQAQNVKDMWDRGRAKILTGEDATKAKLTVEQVAEIRRRFVTHDKVNGARALGREFGVTHQSISAIVTGKHWKGVA